MALTKVSYAMITGAPVNVLDFGAVGDGVANDTIAIQAAIDSISDDGVLVVPPGTYKVTATLTVGALNKGARIVGIGLPTFNFVGLGASADGINIVGANYRQAQIQNLIIDLNGVGRDCIRLQAGDHDYIENVFLNNAGRYGFAIICDGYDWVENLNAKNIVVNDSGQSAFYVATSGSLGAFINECVFEECECRGVSLLANNGAAVYALCAGSGGGSQITNIRWVNCNFDAQRQKALDNGFDTNPNPMYLGYSAGATNQFISWHIDTGGWETTSGGPDYRSQGLIYCEPNSVNRGFNISNITPGGWSGGGYVGLNDYVVHDVQYGTFRAQYPNSWIQQSMSASATYDFDIPIPNQLKPSPGLNRLSIAAAYQVNFFHTSFTAVNQEAYKQDLYLTYWVSGSDQYGVLYGAFTNTLVGSDQFTVNAVTVLNSSGNTTLNQTNTPALVRINVTTTANWGAGGGDAIAYGIVSYMGASHGNYSG